MKSRILFMAVLALAIAASSTAIVADAEDEHTDGEDKLVTLKGEILDMACWVPHEAKGAEHAGCAQRCVQGGQPMGLLAEDGTVYLLFAGHKDASAFEAAKDLAGKRVEIMGMGAARGGVKAIEVRTVRGL